MRTINREISRVKVENVAEMATAEQIVNIFEDKRSKVISIVVALTNVESEFIYEEHYEIKSDHYELLMSEYPDFAPSKPKNEYREEDIWHFVDLIRSV